jgi:hypothetical protein
MNSPQSSPPPNAPRTRELVFVKAGERFVFRYTEGDEEGLLQTLKHMAHDPASGLDWFDAAVLTHQLGVAMSRRLQGLIAPA